MINKEKMLREDTFISFKEMIASIIKKMKNEMDNLKLGRFLIFKGLERNQKIIY